MPGLLVLLLMARDLASALGLVREIMNSWPGLSKLFPYLGESAAAPFLSSDRGTAPFLTGVSGGSSLSNSSGEMKLPKLTWRRKQ